MDQAEVVIGNIITPDMLYVNLALNCCNQNRTIKWI